MVKNIYYKNLCLKNFKNGVLEKKDLNTLSSLEFQHWCVDYLSNQGYSNFISIKQNSQNNKYLSCVNGLNKYLVNYINGQNIKTSIDDTAIKNFIGLMIGSNVNKGIIISTGSISKCALEYMENLPQPYHIEVIKDDALFKYT